MQTFAREWIDAWNRRDVERVLGHYHQDCEFMSPRATVVTGEPLVRGKPALRAYWLAALARIQSLRFELDRALWDPEQRALSLVYESVVDGRRSRACEVMWFGADDLIRRGEAFYGA